MSFFRLWLTGYLHPGRAFEALRDKPAPHWGLYGVLLRGLIMGVVWYLPRALMGLRPALAPVLPFPPVESYYWHALWYFPVFELAKWLLLAAIMHLALRLLRLPSDYDVLLNLSGITALIIDPAIRVWDWIVYAAGWSENTVLMGAAHALVFWPWGLALAVIGMRKLLGLPARVVVPLQLLVLALFIPLAATFLRP